MKTINPQYINDANGDRALVVLSIDEFDAIMEKLEDLEDLRLYDEAKKEDSGQRLPFDQYLQSRKKRDV
ncbi:hypothetical protein J0A68_05905 [Algoriphagus sp. H41]|uniref:Type II toxin-antitoxin system Phd/YefM family antitoxin n=1 Tax=Algoriphagus oliviformis TaxID=2811231 RepID=A0ABS3C1L3_9BACT|nr:hypothetical protein [Algoriphagus oliviformis]MBN7810479.1 hypothetical protein [Algoriphagus oliviformis]